MADIPNVFQFTPQVVASYDYTDIADGTGYAIYYLLDSKDASGSAYYLVPTNSISSAANSANGWSGTNYIDLDVTFNRPQTIKGMVHFSGEVNHTGTDGTVTAVLQKISGGSTSTLGAELATFTKTADLGFCISWDVSQTHFKSGDTLRLRVKTSSVNLYISLDPSGTTPSGITPAKLAIPFKLTEIGY